MKPQDPRNTEELERMLHAGMGRAILFLMSQDLSQYRDLILDSCLHNHAYDQQCEETRAEYLYPLIKMSGEEEFYRHEILHALIETTDMWDAEQLLDFAVIFARTGDAESREAIYEKLRRNDMDEPLYADEALLDLDGTRGLIFLLDLIGRDPKLMCRDDKRPLAPEDCVTLNSDEILIEKAEKKLGVEEVRVALQKAVSEYPNVAVVIDHMANYSPYWTAEEIVGRREEMRQDFVWRDAESIAIMTWEEVKRSPRSRGIAYRWVGGASEDEFRKAAADLAPAEETERLKKHLFLFHKRPFPLDPDPLIRLVDHPDEWVVVRALTALELVRHADVRALFHRLVGDAKWSERAIGLLRSNYQQGDCELIVELLEKETDPDRLDSMCGGAMHVYRDNPVSEGMRPLLLVYEKTPCSMCRLTCIEIIEMIGELPEWMVEECLHDAYSSTRELALEIRQGTHRSPGD